MGWDDYVHLAFDEIRIAGAGSPQVARRLQAALNDLLSIVPTERSAVLEDEVSRLSALSAADLVVDRDVEEAMARDAMGIGGPTNR
jgi:uncharacterized membrane protein